MSLRLLNERRWMVIYIIPIVCILTTYSICMAICIRRMDKRLDKVEIINKELTSVIRLIGSSKWDSWCEEVGCPEAKNKHTNLVQMRGRR